MFKRPRQGIAKTQGVIPTKHRGLKPVLFLKTSLLLFPLSRPPFYCLSRSCSVQPLARSQGGESRGKKKKKGEEAEEKWVRATYFFSHSSRRQRVAVLSSVRRGAGPDGEAGPCRETQPLRTGSAAEATSCKRLVILGEKSCK